MIIVCPSCRLVDLTDVTPAVEDANAKLVDIVVVADSSAEESVDDRLLTAWQQFNNRSLKFGHNILGNLSKTF